MPKTAIVHLVSPLSGDLMELLIRKVVFRLRDVRAEPHLWPLIRTRPDVERVLAAVRERPGFVFHTLGDEPARRMLEAGCHEIGVPVLPVLEPFVTALAAYVGAQINDHVAGHSVIDDDYMRRLEAMRFTLAHDDGHGMDDLDQAEVVVVGVSRATKTPTCMFLAHRGIRAANIPLVPGVPLPEELLRLRGPLVVGLTINPARLAAVREERLRLLTDAPIQDYVDVEAVTGEIVEARRLFRRRGWPIVDVSDRSIEQTAALILQLLQKHGERAR
jgi:hypothetical protein